jgi:hypothetical protein
MAVTQIRRALEIALNAITPAISSAWENMDFTPQGGTPYQDVYLLPAEPENPEFGGSIYRERGILQVTLKYPAGTGPSLAAARAELIQSTFFRGASFTNGGLKVIIDRTPEIMPYYVDGDRYCIPVRIRYFANT